MDKPASLQEAVSQGLITQKAADNLRRLVESGDVIELLLTTVEMTISNLQADLALLNRAYDLACTEVVEVDEGNCPGCPKGNKFSFHKGCNVPRERFWKCWRDYFMAKAEKEGVASKFQEALAEVDQKNQERQKTKFIMTLKRVSDGPAGARGSTIAACQGCRVACWIYPTGRTIMAALPESKFLCVECTVKVYQREVPR